MILIFFSYCFSRLENIKITHNPFNCSNSKCIQLSNCVTWIHEINVREEYSKSVLDFLKMHKFLKNPEPWDNAIEIDLEFSTSFSGVLTYQIPFSEEIQKSILKSFSFISSRFFLFGFFSEINNFLEMKKHTQPICWICLNEFIKILNLLKILRNDEYNEALKSKKDVPELLKIDIPSPLSNSVKGVFTESGKMLIFERNKTLFGKALGKMLSYLHSYKYFLAEVNGTFVLSTITRNYFEPIKDIKIEDFSKTSENVSEINSEIFEIYSKEMEKLKKYFEERKIRKYE